MNSMRRGRVLTLDLLAELPGRPFSQAELEVRQALDRCVGDHATLRSPGWADKLLRPGRLVGFHAKLGQDLLYARGVIARSPEHREAFRNVLAGLPPGLPYRRAFDHLLDQL